MKIAILTNFDNFRSGYSLTGIVRDQWSMLTAFGHEVTIFVNQGCDVPEGLPASVATVIPKGHLIDYGVDPAYPSCDSLTDEHEKLAERVQLCLERYLKDYDLIVTHDWVFTGWNLPYCAGMKAAMENLPGARWLHWIHSHPLIVQDWHVFGRYGKNSKLIFPTTINRQFIVDQFLSDLDDVRIIPHIKDPRSFMRLRPDTIEFINAYPHILQSDIVQVYPIGTDRLVAKGLRELILLFAGMKKMKRRVCLIVPNSWATQRKDGRDSLDIYKRTAERNGLRWGRDVIITSEFKSPTYEIGIPIEMVADLFRLSNLFIFPTLVESFGLILVEALMSGGILTVANRNVDSFFEVTNGTGMFAEFPSYRTSNDYDYQGVGERVYFEKLSKQIVAVLESENGIMGATRAIQRYNWNNVYHKHYEPMLAESELWD